MARQEILERLADQHEAQIKRTLATLEANIVSQIAQVTSDQGVISTQISIELRKDIKRLMEQY